MTQFTYMAIKVADEDQFNQVAEKLRGMGYEADKDRQFGTWEYKLAGRNFHVLTEEGGWFSIHNHDGNSNPTRYTFNEFMKL